MENIEKIFAKTLIKSASDIHSAVSSNLVSHKSRKIKKIPPLKEWLKYYRSSKLVFEATTIELLSLIKLDYEEDFSDITSLIDKQLDGISADTALDHISDYKLQFFIRIIVPCIILHGQFPSTILRRARNGNEEAIEKLSRIDHSVIHDSRISQYIFALSFRNPTRYKFLIKSLTKDHSKPGHDEIKISLAALISHINSLISSAYNNKKMTYTQIRDLFIDEAKLRGLEDDIDLPPGDDAFSRRIRRNNMWNELFKVPDKN